MYHCIIETDSDDNMKIQAFLESAAAALLVASSAEAFSPGGSRTTTPTTPMSQLRAEIGDTGVAFEHVAREWRCKVRSHSFSPSCASERAFNGSIIKRLPWQCMRKRGGCTATWTSLTCQFAFCKQSKHLFSSLDEDDPH